MTTTTFQDTSTDCAICLLPLFDDEKEKEDSSNNNNNNRNSNSSSHNSSSNDDVITLTCGHRWHLSCIKNQLQHSQPNPSRRLVFRGTTCAKCNQVCSTDNNHDDPELNHLTRKIDNLRSKVEELIKEQLLVDKIEIEEIIDEKEEEGNKANSNADYKSSAAATRDQSLMEYAWRKYAFYLCSNCKEPYFGGTIECADQPEGEIQDSKDRLCIACSNDIAVSSSSSSNNSNNNNSNNTNNRNHQNRNCCRNIAQHRSYLVWKCRYCCKPSTYVCYGNVHFCNDCHQRNTIRVQQQQQQRQNSNSNLPPPLEAIPCPCSGEGEGGSGNNTKCPYPKPAISTTATTTTTTIYEELYHKNGPTRDCEQIYGCTLCESSSSSSSSGSSISRWDIPNGSRNLIINPSGEDGLRGWQVLRTGGGGRRRNGRRSQAMPWQVETSDLPTVSAIVQHQNDDNDEQQQHGPTMIRTNFVSSFMWCQMVQSIPLYRYVHNPSNIRQIEVAAQYRGRTDCPSIFKLEVILLNQQNNPIHRASTQILDAPQDGWDRTSLLVDVQSIMVAAAAAAANNNNNSTDVHSLLYIIHGKDRRFWQGLYGSKVCDCSVRILGSNEQLQELLLPINNNDDDDDDATVNNNIRQQQGQHHQPAAYHNNPEQVAADNQRLLFQQAILPVVCLILFLWLFGS